MTNLKKKLTILIFCGILSYWYLVFTSDSLSFSRVKDFIVFKQHQQVQNISEENQNVIVTTLKAQIGLPDETQTAVRLVTSPAIPSSDLQTSDKNLKQVIAIGCAISTRKINQINADTIEKKLPVFRELLPSFCKTASVNYTYVFYISYDVNDAFFTGSESNLRLFEATFNKLVETRCGGLFKVDLKLIKLPHFGKPAWAQNDAMMAAYLDGVLYYYRINDDTVLGTTKWTERFIEILSQQNFQKVAVTGPTHSGGSLRVLTYDFVHRTHILIHGFYYPRDLYSLYSDYWITEIYRPDRCIQPRNVRIHHSQGYGTRYSLAGLTTTHRKIAPNMILGKTRISNWLSLTDSSVQVLADKGPKPGWCLVVPGQTQSVTFTQLLWMMEYANHTLPMFKQVMIFEEITDDAKMERIKTFASTVELVFYTKSSCSKFPQCIMNQLPNYCKTILYWDITKALSVKAFSLMKNWLLEKNESFCVNDLRVFGFHSNMHGDNGESSLEKLYETAILKCSVSMYSFIRTAAAKGINIIPVRTLIGVATRKNSDTADAILCDFDREDCSVYFDSGKIVFMYVRVKRTDLICKDFTQWKTKIVDAKSKKVQFLVVSKVEKDMLVSMSVNASTIHVLPPKLVRKYKPPTVSIVTNSAAKSEDQVMQQTLSKKVGGTVKLQLCDISNVNCYADSFAIVLGEVAYSPELFNNIDCKALPFYTKSKPPDETSDKFILQYNSIDELSSMVRGFQSVKRYNVHKTYQLYIEIETELHLFHFWQSVFRHIEIV